MYICMVDAIMFHMLQDLHKLRLCAFDHNMLLLLLLLLLLLRLQGESLVLTYNYVNNLAVPAIYNTQT